MVERVVSVKIPSRLLLDLDRLRGKHHYLDLSEQLRSIVRDRCLELTNPYTTQLHQLKHDLATQTSKEQVLHDIIRQLTEERK